MAISNYPGGFSGGLTVRGMPILNSYPGNVFWVDSSGPNSSDGNVGTFGSPFATIAGGLAQCSAGNGDILLVQAGHVETITTATALLFNVAGVAIIGLGCGSSRPTLTFATNTTANIPITAANVTIKNILFRCNKAALVSFFTATGTATPTDFCVDTCEFRDLANNLNALTVITGNATANSMDGLTFMDSRISSLGTTAATTAIKILSDTDRVTITNNYGNWAVLNDTAAMLAAGTTQITNLDFGHNRLSKPNTGSTGGSFISGSGNAWTGMCYDNYLWQVDASAGIWIATGHGTALGFVQNFSPITGGADVSALINPAAA